MHFIAGHNYDGSISQGAVPAFYRAKVRSCINEANTKLLGPNGEKLNITISMPVTTCEKLTSNVIEIMSDDHRSNSEQYASDIECPTITHEILHILGLADEYDERDFLAREDPRLKLETEFFQKAIQEVEFFIFGGSLDSAYDCRFVNEDSIMSDHWDRWDSAFEEETSLLSSRHFNFILYGRCQEKNQLFDECTQQAYQHSLDNSACLEIKEECEKFYTSN